MQIIAQKNINIEELHNDFNADLFGTMTFNPKDFEDGIIFTSKEKAEEQRYNNTLESPEL